MNPSLKTRSEQTVVVTGVSSGIGFTTALQAAKCGAQVVLAARNEAVLQQVVSDIMPKGGKAIYIVTDASKHEQQIDNLAQRALAHYGRFDTWVNTPVWDFRAAG